MFLFCGILFMILSVSDEEESCIQQDCHQDMVKRVYTYVHTPVKEGDCGDCHEGDIEEHKFKLVEQGKALCLECHDVPEDKVIHSPVNEDCMDCHSPHGSSNPYNLIEYFSTSLYNPFGERAYALCFECHDIDAFEKNGETNFRNGKLNLHYLHTNRKKGRGCIVCHNPHSSNQKKLIREKVPFSKVWSYQIKFIMKKNGGKCITECHSPKSYSR